MICCMLLPQVLQDAQGILCGYSRVAAMLLKLNKGPACSCQQHVSPCLLSMLKGAHSHLPRIALSIQGAFCVDSAPPCLHLQAGETRSGWSLTCRRSDVIRLLQQTLPVLAQSDEAQLAWQDAAQHTEAALLAAMAANLSEALPQLQACFSNFEHCGLQLASLAGCPRA